MSEILENAHNRLEKLKSKLLGLSKVRHLVRWAKKFVEISIWVLRAVKTLVLWLWPPFIWFTLFVGILAQWYLGDWLNPLVGERVESLVYLLIAFTFYPIANAEVRQQLFWHAGKAVADFRTGVRGEPLIEQQNTTQVPRYPQSEKPTPRTGRHEVAQQEMSIDPKQYEGFLRAEKLLEKMSYSYPMEWNDWVSESQKRKIIEGLIVAKQIECSNLEVALDFQNKKEWSGVIPVQGQIAWVGLISNLAHFNRIGTSYKLFSQDHQGRNKRLAHWFVIIKEKDKSIEVGFDLTKKVKGIDLSTNGDPDMIEAVIKDAIKSN